MRTSHHDQVRIAASSDLEYRAVGEASRHLGVYIVRPEKRRLAAEAFRSRFLLCRKSSNHLPRPAAAEGHVPRHVVQRVQKGDACSMAASKLHRGSQRDSGGD